MKQKLATHEVTWSHRDSYCKDQYANPQQPEEFPTATVKTTVIQLEDKNYGLNFDSFNFSLEEDDE